MKHCRLCSKVLPISEFPTRSLNTQAPNAYCRPCQREYSRRHYAANKHKHNHRRRDNQKRYVRGNRQNLLEYLLHRQCVDCGERDPVVLDLDHVLGVKKFNIGDAISRLSWVKIAGELEKCEVRCANCHRRKTAKQFQWFKSKHGA
jgi:hypothetical protein